LGQSSWKSPRSSFWSLGPPLASAFGANVLGINENPLPERLLN
jgi:hypothetical protein